jgi:hypothetical protein
MYAAMMKLSIDPKRAPEAASAFTNRILPKVSSSKGFVSGCWVDPIDGEGFGFLIFDTEDQASKAANTKSNWSAPGVKILDVEIRRVAVKVP